ncbi:MAG: hypothetical protein ACI86M_003021 [Saprospiraceae bacterium]|jgi:hypothetical protein
MKNGIFLLAFIFTGCFTFDDVENSICVDRCFIIEGTIMNSVTKEPLQNIQVEGSYLLSRLLSKRDIKAKSETDINGFYTMRFEIFDEEIDGNGHFEVQINNRDDKLFWPYGQIDLLEIYKDDYNYDSVYVADFLIPKPATVKYDMDCLSHLKEDERVTFSVNYTFESVTGPINTGKELQFKSEAEKDDGKIKVPAGVPLTIVATLISPAGSTELEKLITTLSENESIKVEVGL